MLIEVPILDSRNEEQLAAEAAARLSDPTSPSYCPELTNHNPGSPHMAILEVMAWLLGQQAYLFNQFPERDLRAFLRVLGIEMRDATPATTTLRFTVAAPTGSEVVIPKGTTIATADGETIFETSQELVIPAPQSSGVVSATCTVTGAIQLAANSLTTQQDFVAYVTSVTNEAAIDSGTDAETIAQATERARRYLRRGERLVSTDDIESAILDEALLGNGIVRAFPFVPAGAWRERRAGHTTVVAMTRAGAPLSEEQSEAISLLMAQLVGNQYVHIVAPVYVDFKIEATVKILGGPLYATTPALIEANLRAHYSAKAENFGRDILRSEIIAIIEGTSGVDRLVPMKALNPGVEVEPQPLTGGSPGGTQSPTYLSPILAAPRGDRQLAPYELPRIEGVEINVV